MLCKTEDEVIATFMETDSVEASFRKNMIFFLSVAEKLSQAHLQSSEVIVVGKRLNLNINVEM